LIDKIEKQNKLQKILKAKPIIIKKNKNQDLYQYKLVRHKIFFRGACMEPKSRKENRGREEKKVHHYVVVHTCLTTRKRTSSNF